MAGDVRCAAVRFFVVRHGKTLFNDMGKVQGWCDTPLLDESVEQARLLGRALAERDFVAAFSSDSGRAVQTLDAILAGRAEASDGTASAPQMRAADKRLREWCYGDLEGDLGQNMHRVLTAGFGADLPFEEHNRRLPEVAAVIANADTSGRAERFDVVEQRLRGFFDEAGEAVRLAGGGDVLVVSHSFAIRSLMYLLDPARVNDPPRIRNLSITEIRYDGTSLCLEEAGSMAWQDALRT